MATQYDSSNFDPNNLFGSNLGVGSNTAPAPVYTPIHSGSWGGLPDLGLTESLQGKPVQQPVSMNFDYSKGLPNQPAPVQNQSAIDVMVSQGWDRAAAQQDLLAHPEKIPQLLGQPSGSSGGGNDKTVSKRGDTRATSIINDPTAKQDFLNSGMDMDQYLSLIDQEAQKSLDFLGQQESAVGAEREAALGNIEKQRGINKQTAYTAKEDAQTAARRLYNELQMGYRQRFGGASSAGEAAQALTNVEQQRQMAANNRTYQNAVTQVDTSADSAIQSAQSEFRNQLLSIAQNRTAVESEKLQARRQALSDLSNKVFQIQQQRETFKQNLQLMQEQARLQNASNLSSLTTNPTSSLTFNNQATTASGNQGLTGAIGAIGKTSTGLGQNQDDILKAQGIYPVQSLRNGQIMYSDGIAR